MLGWIVGKLKWLAVLGAVVGPIVALSCWHDANRRQDLMATGVQTDATIDSATRVKRRRGGTSYKLDLSWTDAGGLRHKAEGISVSHALAGQLIVDNQLAADRLPIKYAPVQAGTTSDENLIVLDDTAYQEQTDQQLVYVGAGVGVIGLIASVLFFRPRRRDREPVAA